MPTETFKLSPGYEISRVIYGAWQLAGGHGLIDQNTAVADLVAFCESGIFTFDCADIYTGVEELIAEFRKAYRNSHGAEADAHVKVHTKFVPDLDSLPLITKDHVRSMIEQSLRRLRADQLDLVQFHWWDYTVPHYVQTALWLKELKQEGLINLIGATNFDQPRTAQLLDAGVPLVSMQVQYSLLDLRPEHGLIDLCRRSDVHVLSYGSVGGGFLSDIWLGRTEPAPPFENRSLTKYKFIIDEFGGWNLFQHLLSTLREIADRHRVDIATVASRAILDRAQVAAVIVGARNRAHLESNLAIMQLQLMPSDHAKIEAALADRSGPVGDAFGLERDSSGRHGSIMKYNLNKQVS